MNEEQSIHDLVSVAQVEVIVDQSSANETFEIFAMLVVGFAVFVIGIRRN